VSWLEAVVLGLVQGLTEFLPVSSSGHVLIVPAIAGWDDPGAAFSAVIQIGTMAAVLVYFRADLWRMATAFGRSLTGERKLWRTEDVDGRTGWLIVLGTIPIVIFGFAFSSQIENNVRALELVASVLVLFSFVMRAADRTGRRDREVSALTVRDGLVIGGFQVLALVPGVSRSGSTIAGGLFLGLTREAATRYSFLLSVPAVVLSGLYQLKDVGGEGAVGAGQTAVAAAFAFVSGYAAIAFLLRFVRTHNFDLFVVYRVSVGLIVLALAASGVIA